MKWQSKCRKNQLELERNPVMRQLLTLCLADVGEGEALDDSAQRLEALSQQLPPGHGERRRVCGCWTGRLQHGPAVWEELPRTVTHMSLQSLFGIVRDFHNHSFCFQQCSFR